MLTRNAGWGLALRTFLAHAVILEGAGQIGQAPRRSKTVRIYKHFTAALVIAGAAAALGAAPLAEAAPTGPTCVSVGQTATQCQSNGNAELNASPPAVDYSSQYPFFGPYALIFHHGGRR
jgi:hypothetical protein